MIIKLIVIVITVIIVIIVNYDCSYNYNYVKLNTNDTDYTLSKEALPRQGWDTPIKLQIKTTNNNANYGDPIPVQVDD